MMLLGARQFFERRGAPTPPFPYDAEVEYLESTGTQFIDTGVYADNETAVELLCKYTQSFQDNAVISMDAGNSLTRAFTVEIYNARVYFVFSNTTTQNASLQSSWNQISASQNGLIVNGTSVSVSQAPAFQCEYSLFMFCYGRKGVPIIYGKWQIANCKIYQTSVLVRDYIPVRLTNELGQSEGAMYDRVSGALFRNAGTGAFTIGPDVYRVPSTVGQYVQNGLVAMWDGIENAGWGVHDPNATVWKDLIGGTEISSAKPYDTMMSIRGDFGASVQSSTPAMYYINSDFTLHGVIRAPDTKDWSQFNLLGLGKSSFLVKGFTVTGNNGSTSAPYAVTYQTKYGSGGAIGGDISTGKNAASLFSVDIVFSYSTKTYVVYVDGERMGDFTIPSDKWVLDGEALSIGAASYSGTLNDATGFKRGNVLYYSRALTAAEIAANYAIDKARFNLP